MVSIDIDNQGAGRGKRGHPNLKDAFRPRTVGITAPGVDRVVADKAQTYCPRLEGLAPWFLRSRNCPDTYKLLNSLMKRENRS